MNRRDLFRLLLAAPLAAMVKVHTPPPTLCFWNGRITELEFRPGGVVTLTTEKLLQARKLLNEASVEHPVSMIVHPDSVPGVESWFPESST